MPALMNLNDAVRNRRLVYGVESDFEEFVSGDKFTDTSADAGATIAASDAAGGVAVLTTGAVDNNEAYLLSTSEIFLIALDKPILASCRLKYSEANTNAANVAFGLMNAVAANSIVDNGAGLQSSYSGATFYKVDGGLNWKVEASVATTRYGAVELTAANSLDKVAKVAASTAYQWLDIEIIPFSSTQAKVNFYIDEVLVQSVTMTYTSATEMMVFVGVKAGSGSSEVVNVDYLGAWQKR
jgi:hypothetical protein